MSKIVALMLVRNEEWCLGLTLRVALQYCDAAVVCDHASQDRTPQIISEVEAEHPGRISRMTVDVPWWDEMDVRQSTLVRGRAIGGTHFVVVDADELITGNLMSQARDMVLKVPRGTMMSLPMVSTYHGLNIRRLDGNWGRRSRIAWAFCDDGRLCWRPDDGYQHHCRIPHGAPKVAEPFFTDMSGGGIFHLQFASLARLRAKAAHYKMTEVIRWPGRKSARDLNQMYDWTLAEGRGPDQSMPERANVPSDWWSPYDNLAMHLRVDDPPWQAAEARRLFAHYGAAKFAGLELHGVVANGDPVTLGLTLTPEDLAVGRDNRAAFAGVVDVKLQELRVQAMGFACPEPARRSR